MTETMTLKALLHEAVFIDEFCARHDIVVRYMAVEHYEKRGEVLPLFEKMDVLRKQTISRLEIKPPFDPQRLLRTMARTKREGPGHNPDVPLFLGSNHRIIEGAHRIACFMYYGVETVYVERKDRLASLEFFGWWVGYFTGGEVVQVLKKARELRDKFG